MRVFGVIREIWHPTREPSMAELRDEAISALTEDDPTLQALLRGDPEFLGTLAGAAVLASALEARSEQPPVNFDPNSGLTQ